MARMSRRQRRRYINFVVVAAIAALILAAYASFHRDAIASGVQAAGSALILLGICLMFTWPTKCRVATTKELPCKLDSYGLLLGCSQYHRSDKLRIRLGMVSRDGLTNAKPADGPEIAIPGIWAKDSVVTLTLGSAKGDTGAFILGLVSALAGVASVVVSILALR